MKNILPFKSSFFIVLLCLFGFQSLFGQAGDALEFDGDNSSRVTIPDDPSLDLSNGTIEMWVYYTGVGGNKYFVDKNLEYLFRTANQKFQVLIHAGGTYQTLADPGTLTPNTWYHLAVTYDGTAARLYRDGNPTPVATSTISGSINNTTNALHLGARPTNAGEAWTGALDEFRVWNKALTGAEIAELYDKTLTGGNVMTCLGAYYKMSDGSGTTLTDDSGNGNTGTISGNTTWVTSTAGVTGTLTPGSCSQLLLPEIDVQGNSTSIPNGDNTPEASDDTDFGTQAIGSMTDHTFTIKNTGGATLNLTGNPIVAISGDSEFTIQTQPSASSIASGGADLTFVVRYEPNAAATHTATISIANDDSDENPYTFQVTGMGEALTPAAALQFDGTDDFIDLGTPTSLNFDNTDAFTIEAWVKVTGGGQYEIVSNMRNNVFRGYEFFIAAGRIYLFFCSTIGSNQIQLYNTAGGVSDGNWHHVAVTHDGSSDASGINLYVDGISQALTIQTNTLSNSTTNSEPVLIGSRDDHTYYFPGQMDEIRIWSIARTCDEIAYYSNCELTGTENNLEAYYQFNQGNDEGTNTGVTTLDDLTANNLDGTLTNFALTGSSSNWVAPGGVVTGNTCSGVPAGDIVGTFAEDVCTSFSATIPDNGNWTPINDASGNNVIMEINAPPGTDLGVVTLQIIRNSTIETHPDGNDDQLKIMPRYFQLSSANFGSGVNFPSNVGLRFYFENSDLVAMNAANMGANGKTNYLASQIAFTHYSGPNEDCDLSNNNMIATNVELINSLTTTAYGCGGFYVETSVNHFSEFIGHEPTTQPLLPVELVSFTARKNGNQTQLSWQTASEINNEGFFVQWAVSSKQLADGAWETIGFVEGNGTTAKVQNYEFIHDRPANGINYYRLKQMDFDGKFAYSEIKSVQFDNGQTLPVRIFPNPVNGENLTVQLDDYDNEEILIQLYDLTGKTWLQQTSFESTINVKFDDLSAGIYIIEIAANGQTIRQKIVRN